jgi:hypothetical protein
LFFFTGFDQHIFRVPTGVRFVDGSSVIVPQKGDEPLHHGDYEESDKDLVFAAAAHLNTMTGTFRSELIGNAAFLKVDATLSARHQLSARVNTARYFGTNNIFFDPASPVTTFSITDNREEDVATESASTSLTSGLSARLISHLRAQFSRDLQESSSNSSEVRTRITDILDGFGRSSILPRRTREHRAHFTETLSFDTGRHSWKFGGDALLTWIYNFFPSMFGGEYIFDGMSVDPWNFEPMRYGMKITPLRAYAHEIPRSYIENFGSAVSHPDTNEYAAFLLDTMRVTGRLALSLAYVTTCRPSARRIWSAIHSARRRARFRTTIVIFHRESDWPIPSEMKNRSWSVRAMGCFIRASRRLPSIHPLTRPITTLGAINQFESAASSVYHGATLSVRRRMTNGFYFRVYVCSCDR